MKTLNLINSISILKYLQIKTLFFTLMISWVVQVSAQGPCDFIQFTLEHYNPCCYRLHVDNSTECYPELRLIIDAGTYESFQASTSTGWTCTKISPTELLLTHSSGKVPFGASIPVTFCLEPGFDPKLSILWDNNCSLVGCFKDVQLKGCPIISDACIEGVKYRECDNAIFNKQTTIPNFNILLSDENGLVLGSAVTDSFGTYSFCDLPPGNYVVREVKDPGWTPKVPLSGMYNIALKQSEMAKLNFGNCPGCSCDSIYTDIVPVVENSDTCSYEIIIQNNRGYCFTHFNLNISNGSISDFGIREKGIKIVQLDSQNLRIILPDGSTHKGPTTVMAFACTAGADRKFTLTGYYNTGGGDVACARVFTYTCPRVVAPSCCPTGTIQGKDLVINGNFEAAGTGPIGFTDCFPWFNPGNPTSIGKYSVLQSNQVFAANAQWACTDHTASLPTGKMLIVDGQNTTCNFVWQELVTVQPGVQYAFCAFVNNLVIPTKNYDDPIIQLWINNTQVQTITLAETPDQWQSLNALWPSGLSTTALIQIRLGSQTVVGNDFAVDDISFRSCNMDTCICGPFDLKYSIGRGPLLPYDCGDTLLVPASTAILPIHFLSSFTCLGTNCPQTTVDLILTGPAGFIPLTISGVQANPNFIIPFTNSTFSIAGIYTLTINGHCGSNVCPCTIYFNADGHDCCSNQFDFELGIANAVTITLDSIKCKATLNIGNLPKCDSIGPIFWGDGASSTGPFIAGTMPMHTYAGSGSYFITWTATEYDYSVMPPRKCFEKVFKDSINLDCDTCQCKSFSSMIFINPNWPAAFVGVTCGSPSVQLPCIKPGQVFFFDGRLNCNAINCPRDSIHWNIVQTISGQLVSSGTASFYGLNATPNFNFDLNPVLFNAGVEYMLNITGQCGSNTCNCKINFSFAACPCPCDSIKQDVFQGFYVSGNKLNCNRTVKPAALCPNDKVSWVVTPSITPLPGNSIGNNSQVIQFSNPGIYNVCMFVTLIDSNTNDTCRDSYCRKVTVNCFPNPSLGLCETNAIKNGDFTEGLIKGNLSKSQLAKSRGKIANWQLFPNTGDGLVFVSDSSGASDDGQVILIGNRNNFAGIWQQVDLTPDNFINLRYRKDVLDTKTSRILDHLLAYDIVFRLQNDSTLNASNILEILRQKDPGKKDKERFEQIDTSISFQHDPDLKYLVICLQNQSDSVYSAIGIDNIEMCTSKIPLSTYSEKLFLLRIYPNPSNGHFTIEMQQAATTGMKFRILDIAGRNVFEKQTLTGNQTQNIDASNLASGFYFLQVISKGKVLAVEKLVKQ